MGDITVVFEAGQGETLMDWEPVLRRVYAKVATQQQQQQQQQGGGGGAGDDGGAARKVRLISYSRSGLGLSDAPPSPPMTLERAQSLLKIAAGGDVPPPPPPSCGRCCRLWRCRGRWWSSGTAPAACTRGCS